MIVEETYNRSIRRICNMEKPVVAAVNGVAAGAGANIALACDFVVAKTSVKFIQAFANIGLIPDSGGTYWLPRLVGMARAKALTMFGTPLQAQDAQDMGLIHACVAEDAFQDEVDQLAAKLAGMPTRGLGLTKKALHEGAHNTLSESWRWNWTCSLRLQKRRITQRVWRRFWKRERPNSKGNDRRLDLRRRRIA